MRLSGGGCRYWAGELKGRFFQKGEEGKPVMRERDGKVSNPGTERRKCTPTAQGRGKKKCNQILFCKPGKEKRLL